MAKKKRSARKVAEKKLSAGLSKKTQDNLLELLDAAPDNVWKPEVEGETIMGTIAEMKEHVKSRYDKQPPYTVLGIQTDDKIIYFVGAQTSSRQQLTKLNPQVGDAIAIRYEGETPTSSGFDAKLFKIVTG